VFSPLGGEDPVEDGVLPAVSHGLQDEHVLDDVEGEAVVGQRAQELGLQEGGPLLLQHALASLVALQGHQDERHHMVRDMDTQGTPAGTWHYTAGNTIRVQIFYEKRD